LNASDKETFVSVNECQKQYSIANCIVNIKNSMDELKYGWWKKLLTETDNYFRGFYSQQDEIRNILVLIHEVPGE
jgi:hypothetical protein